MTRIKLCGLSRLCDIETANALCPDDIGFVFAKQSRRCVTPEQALVLRRALSPGIRAVGVFVDEDPAVVAALLNGGIIGAAQLHGSEDAAYLQSLRKLTDGYVIQAFRIRTASDILKANRSEADCVLLDAGAGTGTVFDWTLLGGVDRPYYLAGGLDETSVAEAIRTLRPYGVDVSSGIETDGLKDRKKMAAFTAAVRRNER